MLRSVTLLLLADPISRQQFGCTRRPIDITLWLEVVIALDTVLNRHIGVAVPRSYRLVDNGCFVPRAIIHFYEEKFITDLVGPATDG